MTNKLDEKKRKRRSKKSKYDSISYTTGSIELNIDRFNKAMGTFSSEDADCDFGGNLAGDASCSESLTEAKRYVRRYYIRPQNIFCSNKAEIIKSLIELDNANCSVYTLNNLGDDKDVSKLMNNDIIYYYDDGILYDKNRVKVMDYDLSIKKEENRRHFANVDKAPEKEFKAEYSDRMTDATELEEAYDESISGELFTAESLVALLNSPEVLQPIRLGINTQDADIMSVGQEPYSDTEWTIYEDIGGYTLTSWLNGSDGETMEGYSETFSSIEDLAEAISKLEPLTEVSPLVKSYLVLKTVEEALEGANLLDEAFNLDFDSVYKVANSIEEDLDTFCCICGEPINGYGNNPEPFMSSDEGVCCDGCNIKFVIPKRIEEFKKSKEAH